MSLIDDVNAYETWMRGQCAVVEADLDKKHRLMASDVFPFFRATCFRFARTVETLAPTLKDAPATPCVGDAHIENFGTWRDAEGRLVWGVNDFDEAAILPYTYDLLRLAVSVRLAPGLPGTNTERTAAILKGYQAGLTAPAARFVDDGTEWMRTMVGAPASLEKAFRGRLNALTDDQPPPSLAGALRGFLPEGTGDIRIGGRQSGAGSLGRPRFVAFGVWRGDTVARETKAMLPSAWSWATGTRWSPDLLTTLALGTHRAPDPFLKAAEGFVFRRLAADSAKLELTPSLARTSEPALLAAMGADLAAVHVGNGFDPKTIGRDLGARAGDWLYNAAKIAAAAVQTDFETWRAYVQDQDQRQQPARKAGQTKKTPRP